MKSNATSELLSGKLAIPIVVAVILFSCSKSSDSNTTLKFCKSITWGDTSGRTGSFTSDDVNNVYELTGVSYKEASTAGGSVLFTYDASGHLQNQTGLTVTYTQNNLTNFVVDLSLVSKATGTATYTFDSNGFLISTVDAGSDNNGPFSNTVTYTYDNNGDPVHIVGHGSLNTTQGTGTLDFDITADYLTDKDAVLPFAPITAPFSIYFSYTTISSRHLINKLVIKQNESISILTLPEVDFTYQYSYTFDSNGKVSTMSHSGNPTNIYTFNYSGCN